MTLYGDLQIVDLPDSSTGGHRFHVNYALTNREYRDTGDKRIASNGIMLLEYHLVTQNLVNELHNLPQVKTVAVIPDRTHYVEITLNDNYHWEEDDVAQLIVEIIEQHFEWCRLHDHRLRRLSPKSVRQAPRPTSKPRRSGRTK
jgi:hypothetical protein